MEIIIITFNILFTITSIHIFNKSNRKFKIMRQNFKEGYGWSIKEGYPY